MPDKRTLIDKIKYEGAIAKEYVKDYLAMTPSERKKDNELKLALRSNPADQKLINRGKRLDLEARVNKQMRSMSNGQANKSRGTDSSAKRVPLK